MTSKSNSNTSERTRKIKAAPGEEIRDKIKKADPKMFVKIASSQETEMRDTNDRIAQVKIGGKIRYYDEKDVEIAFYSAADMALILGERRVWTWGQELVPTFKWWQAQADRRTYDRVVFEPNSKKVRKTDLNLFKGFKAQPNSKAGSCEKFKAHLLHNICGGNVTYYTYLRKWMASLFQNPGHKIGVAVVLCSPQKGTGKSMVGEYLAYCIGEEYCPGVATPEGLTGKHNGHLAKALLVRVEEALHAQDPRHHSQLQHHITSPRVMIEPKGVDALEMESKSNFIFTSNKQLVVPATADERRYFVLNVAPHKMQDRAYFKAIIDERNTGGAEAFVAELMAEDLTNYDVGRAPDTDGLGDQIAHGLTGLDAWWRDVLTEGRLPWRGEGGTALDRLAWGRGDATDEDKFDALGWPEAGEWKPWCSVVAQSAADHIRSYQGPPSPASVGRFIAKMVPEVKKARAPGGSRPWLYTFPGLDDCRKAFVKAHKGLTLKHVGGVAQVVQPQEAVTPEPANDTADDPRPIKPSRTIRFP